MPTTIEARDAIPGQSYATIKGDLVIAGDELAEPHSSERFRAVSTPEGETISLPWDYPLTEVEDELPESPPIRDRKAQVQREGEWFDVPFMSVRAGDTFRLFESDGSEAADGVGVSVAASDAYEKDGRGVIQTVAEDTPEQRPPVDIRESKGDLLEDATPQHIEDEDVAAATRGALRRRATRARDAFKAHGLDGFLVDDLKDLVRDVIKLPDMAGAEVTIQEVIEAEEPTGAQMDRLGHALGRLVRLLGPGRVARVEITVDDDDLEYAGSEAHFGGAKRDASQPAAWLRGWDEAAGAAAMDPEPPVVGEFASAETLTRAADYADAYCPEQPHEISARTMAEGRASHKASEPLDANPYTDDEQRKGWAAGWEAEDSSPLGGLLDDSATDADEDERYDAIEDPDIMDPWGTAKTTTERIAVVRATETMDALTCLHDNSTDSFQVAVRRDMEAHERAIEKIDHAAGYTLTKDAVARLRELQDHARIKIRPGAMARIARELNAILGASPMVPQPDLVEAPEDPGPEGPAAEECGFCNDTGTISDGYDEGPCVRCPELEEVIEEPPAPDEALAALVDDDPPPPGPTWAQLLRAEYRYAHAKEMVQHQDDPAQLADAHDVMSASTVRSEAWCLIDDIEARWSEITGHPWGNEQPTVSKAPPFLPPDPGAEPMFRAGWFNRAVRARAVEFPSVDCDDVLDDASRTPSVQERIDKAVGDAICTLAHTRDALQAENMRLQEQIEALQPRNAAVEEAKAARFLSCHLKLWPEAARSAKRLGIRMTLTLDSDAE